MRFSPTRTGTFAATTKDNSPEPRRCFCEDFLVARAEFRDGERTREECLAGAVCEGIAAGGAASDLLPVPAKSVQAPGANSRRMER